MKRFGWLAFAALALLAGCAHTRELDVALDKNVRVPEKRALVLFADGVRTEVFDAMLDAGQLPNIQRYIVDRGVRARHAVTVVPSITYAATASINTGRYPGHHQIMGNKWFDRTSGQYQDYMYIRTYQEINRDLRAPTIYEILGDRYSVTIQVANYLGATRPIENWMSSGINWFFRRILEVDRLIAVRFELIAECARTTGTWPDYILAYFPAIDEIGHRYGSDSPQYRQALANLDVQVGRICRGLERNGLLEGYYIFLVSDHGHVPADRLNSWSVEKFLKNDLGIRVVDKMFLEKGNTCERHAYLNDKCDLVLINGGSRRAHLHLRTDEHWFHEPTPQETQEFLAHRADPAPVCRGMTLHQTLAKQTPVRLVAVKAGPDRVEVLHRDARGLIERELRDGVKRYRYTPTAGDPLSYDEPHVKSLLDGQFHESRQWLAASCRSEFPDFVPQVVEMFDSGRAGQIVIFADRGWDFSPIDLGGHGSAIRDDMIVPFFVAGPDIPHGEILTARLVDLVPTVLDIMNLADRQALFGQFDGQSILDELKQTQPAP